MSASLNWRCCQTNHTCHRSTWRPKHLVTQQGGAYLICRQRLPKLLANLDVLPRGVEAGVRGANTAGACEPPQHDPQTPSGLPGMVGGNQQRGFVPMLNRPPSRPFMAILKPLPSPPIRLAAGTRTSSRITAAVGWEFQPSCDSAAVTHHTTRRAGANPLVSALRAQSHVRAHTSVPSFPVRQS